MRDGPNIDKGPPPPESCNILFFSAHGDNTFQDRTRWVVKHISIKLRRQIISA